VTARSLTDLVGRLQAADELVSASFAPGSGRDLPASRAATGIEYDSRRVRPGALFVAVRGAHSDGHDFVAAAETLGASAAIVERPVAGVALPQLIVADARRALAAAAAWWFGDPSRELGVIGVTGTDGKTTTSFLIGSVLEAAGISAGLLTTAASRIGTTFSANAEHVTTPEAPEVQGILRAMVDAGNRAAVLETTSHGLAQSRVADVEYDVAVFTNLTHEHLEFHRTFEAYRAAKLSLFERLGRPPAGLTAVEKATEGRWPLAAVVNADDEAGPLFAEAARGAGAALVTYGLDPSAGVRAGEVAEDLRTLSFEVATPRWAGRATLRLAGRLNVHNALAAIAVGEALHLTQDAILEGLARLEGVPGRMERIDCGQPFGVVVDYAHSPAALEKVLDNLEPSTAGGGGLIAVFGSAGERDVQKRPLMGRIAGERCRVVVVTDEDPRAEDREAILDEIARGAESAGRRRGEDLLCIADREEAIEAAFERARPGDVVLLAGKGHEQSIIMADGPRPWDEKAEAIEVLRRLGFSPGSAGDGRAGRASSGGNG
jgi:UDP-N-acetylmuramoyl-L-alanyl-D-glutamate--2,6-diaminopimelate ligase